MYKKVSELDGKGQKLAYQHWKDDLFSMTNKGYTNISFNNEKLPNFNYCDLYDDMNPEMENQFSFGN